MAGWDNEWKISPENVSRTQWSRQQIQAWSQDRCPVRFYSDMPWLGVFPPSLVLITVLGSVVPLTPKKQQTLWKYTTSHTSTWAMTLGDDSYLPYRASERSYCQCHTPGPPVVQKKHSCFLTYFRLGNRGLRYRHYNVHCIHIQSCMMKSFISRFIFRHILV